MMGLTLCIVQVKDDDDEEEEEEEEEGEGEGEEGEERGGKVTEAYNGSVSGPGPGPGNSPSRGAAVSSGGAKSYMKHSDSSFGLHSPDSFNDDVQVTTAFCIVWSQQANCL